MRSLLRKRFSLKTLLVLVTLAALYMASGSWARRGKVDIIEFNVARNGKMMESTKQTIPFVFQCKEIVVDGQKPLVDGTAYRGYLIMADSHRFTRSTYYLWLFGYVVKIPFTSDGSAESRDPISRKWIAD